VGIRHPVKVTWREGLADQRSLETEQLKPNGKIWDGQAGLELSRKLKTVMDGTCCAFPM